MEWLIHINSQQAETIINMVYNSAYGNRPDTEITIEQRIEAISHHPSLKFYIPLNCAETIYSRESAIDLEDEVNKFLKGDIPVLLLLGDSGAGKSTFCTYLSHYLIKKYQKDNNTPLPILLRLGASLDAVNRGEIIEKEFKRIGLSSHEIATLKRDKEFVFILDGYDELEMDREDKQERKKNFLTTNKLSEWKAKVFITCRIQSLEDDEDYISRFCREDYVSNRPDRKSLKTLYIVPFSSEKVEKYLKKYAPSKDSGWKDWHSYKEEINRLYNLRELATNPLLLSIITQTIPKAKTEGTFNRTKLYREFFKQWFVREKANLKIKTFFRFAEKLAFEMFLSGKTEIEYEKEEDGEDFDDLTSLFASVNPKDIRARSGCPIRRFGNNTYRFMHKSFQEYCVACKFIEDAKLNNEKNWLKHSFHRELIRFMGEIASENIGSVENICKWAIEGGSASSDGRQNHLKYYAATTISCMDSIKVIPFIKDKTDKGVKLPYMLVWALGEIDYKSEKEKDVVIEILDNLLENKIVDQDDSWRWWVAAFAQKKIYENKKPIELLVKSLIKKNGFESDLNKCFLELKNPTNIVNILEHFKLSPDEVRKRLIKIMLHPHPKYMKSWKYKHNFCWLAGELKIFELEDRLIDFSSKTSDYSTRNIATEALGKFGHKINRAGFEAITKRLRIGHEIYYRTRYHAAEAIRNVAIKEDWILESIFLLKTCLNEEFEPLVSKEIKKSISKLKERLCVN